MRRDSYGEGFTDEGVAACNTCSWSEERHTGTRSDIKTHLDLRARGHIKWSGGHMVDVIVTERWIEQIGPERPKRNMTLDEIDIEKAIYRGRL